MPVDVPRSVATTITAALLQFVAVAALFAQDQADTSGAVRQNFGAWATRCYDQPERGPTCVAFQNSVLTDSGARVVYVEAGYPPGQAQPVLFVTAPLGVYLPAGVEVRVDDAAAQPITMLHCDQNGCHAASILEPQVLAAMRDGDKLLVKFRNVSGRVFEVPLPLEGFSAAWEAATSGETPASTSDSND